MKAKTTLRKEILALRDSLTIEERQEKSREIARKVIRHEKFQEADKVLLFASFRSEADTTAIFEAALQMGKEVYFPRVEGKEMEFYQVEKASDLISGYQGIREPVEDEDTRSAIKVRTGMRSEEEPSRIIVIMPGAVFDEACNRIGYGGGYYDKFLQILEHHIKKQNLYKLAIAYQCQIVEKGRIVSEPYDIKPDEVITEETEYII